MCVSRGPKARATRESESERETLGNQRDRIEWTRAGDTLNEAEATAGTTTETGGHRFSEFVQFGCV